MSEIHLDNSNDVILEAKQLEKNKKNLKKNLTNCLYRLKATVLNKGIIFDLRKLY